MAGDDLDDSDDKSAKNNKSEGDEAAAKAKKKKKLLILGGGGAAAVLVLGLGLAYFMGVFDEEPPPDEASGEISEEEAATEELPPLDITYLPMPEIMIHIQTAERRALTLRLSVQFELRSPRDVPAVQSAMPRVMDGFQTWLRGLKPDDLSGSQGVYRVREDLLMRVNKLAAPVRISGVMIKEMLLQ